MRLLGALLFAVGCAGTAYCTWAMFAHGRPRDVLFGVLAPLAALVAISGLVLAFVPGFLS